MCREEQRATEESSLLSLGVQKAYIWGFRGREEWKKGGGRKGEGQKGLIPSVYRWN